MRKSPESLTDEKIQLINDNYGLIKQQLKQYFLNAAKKSKSYDPSLFNEALSYVADVTCEYDISMLQKKNYVDFVVERCALRLIDQFRSLNRNFRIFKKMGIVDDIKDSLISHNGSYTEEELAKAIEDENIDPNLIRLKLKSIKSIESECKQYNEDIVVLDQEDQIKSIIKKAEDHFAELSGSHMEVRNKLSKVRKKLIKEYLVPLAIGRKEKNLEQISKEVNLSKGRLSQLIKDDSMKIFIKSFYSDFDSKGIPIPTKKIMHETR